MLFLEVFFDNKDEGPGAKTIGYLAEHSKAYTGYASNMGIIGKSDYDRIRRVLPVREVAMRLCGTFETLSVFPARHAWPPLVGHCLNPRATPLYSHAFVFKN